MALLFTGPLSEVLGRTRLIHTSLIASAEMHPAGYPRTAGRYVGGNALGGMTGRP